MGRNSTWSPTRIYNRSIIFNTFLCDLFLFIKNKEVARYADYTTPYETGADSAYVIHNSEVWETHFWTGLTATVRKLILINIIFFYLVMTPVESQSEMKQFPVVNARNVYESK